MLYGGRFLKDEYFEEMNEILIGLECFEREFDCFFFGMYG